MKTLQKILAYVTYIMTVCMVGLVAVRVYQDYNFVAYAPFAACLFLLGYNGRRMITWMSSTDD